MAALRSWHVLLFLLRQGWKLAEQHAIMFSSSASVQGCVNPSTPPPGLHLSKSLLPATIAHPPSQIGPLLTHAAPHSKHPHGSISLQVIKKRIESLIEREFLERDATDRTVYRYLA